MGKGGGGEIAKSSGAFFFIWTIIALGVTALFSVILSVRGLWGVDRFLSAGLFPTNVVSRRQASNDKQWPKWSCAPTINLLTGRQRLWKIPIPKCIIHLIREMTINEEEKVNLNDNKTPTRTA